MDIQDPLSNKRRQPESITVGHVEFRLIGDLASMSNAGKVSARVEETFDRMMFLRFPARQSLRRHAIFTTDGQTSSLDKFQLLTVDVTEGSLLLRAAVISNLALATISGLAAYPNLKEALPLIHKDIGFVIEYFQNEFNERFDKTPGSIRIEESRVIMRPEDEFRLEVAKKIRKPVNRRR